MKWFLFFLGCLWGQFSLADPFYPEQTANPPSQAVNNEAEFAKNASFITACSPTEELSRLQLTTPFDELKLVGLVQFDAQTKALFLDKDQHLIDLSAGTLLTNGLIEIQAIDLKQVHYVDWEKSQNCTEPLHFTRRL